MDRHFVVLGLCTLAACSAAPSDGSPFGNAEGGQTAGAGGGVSGGASTGGEATSGGTTVSGEDASSGTAGDAHTTGGQSGEDTQSSTDTSGGSSGGESGTEPELPSEPGLYVSISNGADSNPGTREAPMRTIQWALDEAEAMDFEAVYVAEGVYVATHEMNDAIELVDGISLYGGYSPNDWRVRHLENHPTLIVDESIATNTFTADPHYAVYVSSGVSEATRVDGFVIQSAMAGASAAVLVDGGEATFTNNRLEGRVGTGTSIAVAIDGGAPEFRTNAVVATAGASTYAYGVSCSGGAPIFVRNDIDASSPLLSYSVYYYECDGLLAHNTIRSGAGSPNSTHRTVFLSASSPDVLSNTIAAQHPPNAGQIQLIALAGASTPSIVNNNLVSTSSNARCVYATGAANPSALTHNNLRCDILYYRSGSITSLLDLDQSIPTSSDNISVEAGVVDAASGDLRLRSDGTVVCPLVRGGLDLSADIDPIDFDETDGTLEHRSVRVRRCMPVARGVPVVVSQMPDLVGDGQPR